MKRILFLSILLIPFCLFSQQSLKEYNKYAKALEKGKMKKAEKIAKTFSDDDSQLFLSLLKRVQSYNVAEDAELILSIINNAVTLSHDQNLAYYDKQFIVERDVLVVSTLATIDQILLEYPNIINAYPLKGHLNMELLNYKEAIIDFTNAIPIEKECPYIYGGRALAYMCTDQLKLAIQDYTKSIDLDPTINQSHLNLGFALMTNGNFELAIKNFETAYSISDLIKTKAFALNNIGFCHYKMGDLELAAENVEESLEKFPLNSYAYRNLALIDIAKKDQASVCKNLAKSLELGFTIQYGNEVLELLEANCK